MEEKYICPCGLNCFDCLFYRSEIYETAVKLKKLLKDSQLDVFLTILNKNAVNKAIANHLGEDENNFNKYFEPFNKMPDFFNVLDGIINIQCKKTCQGSGGCSMCGTTKECITIKCVKQKGYSGCWECNDYKNCDKLIFQKSSYGEMIENNFEIIKEKGVEAIKSRRDDYYQWQRRMKK